MAKINLGKVGWLFRGAHNGTLTYTIYDVVTSGGSTYIALQSVPAGILITNTAYWEPVAVKGDQGIQGIQGIQGVKGDTVQNASEVNITDTGNYFTGTTVEGALQEIGTDLADHETRISTNETAKSNYDLVFADRKLSEKFPLKTFAQSVSGYNYLDFPNNANGQISCVIEGQSVTNIVTNGDFRNGTTGWGVVAGGTQSVINEVYHITGNGTSANNFAQCVNGSMASSGNKIYIRSNITKPLLSTRVSFQLYDGVGTTQVGAILPITSELQFASEIITLSINYTSLRIGLRTYFNSTADANGSITKLDNFMAINLTAMGLESITDLPTLDRMFANYIDGTKHTFSDGGVLECKDKLNVVKTRLFIPAQPLRSYLTTRDKIEYNEQTGTIVKTKYVNDTADGLEATPIVTDITKNCQGTLQSYPSGSIQTFPAKNGYTTTSSTDVTGATSVYKVKRFDYDNGKVVEVDVTSACSIVGNNLIISSFQAGKTYHYSCLTDTSTSTVPNLVADVGQNFGTASRNYGGLTTAWTLTDNENKASSLVTTNAGGAVNIIAEGVQGKEFIVRNTSGHNNILKTASSTGVTVANNTVRRAIYLGTDFVFIT